MDLIFSGLFLALLVICAWRDVLHKREVPDVLVAGLWMALILAPGAFAVAGVVFAAFFLGNSLYGSWKGVFPFSWTDMLGIAAYAGACGASGWLPAALALLPGALIISWAYRRVSVKEVPLYAVLALGYCLYLVMA